MSFSADWLALREPVDHASVNADVRRSLATHFAGYESAAVIDLGCGAGSNLRGLAAVLPQRQFWRLVDHDAGLLAAARSRLAAWAEESQADGDALILRKDGKRIEVRFVEADLAAGPVADLLAGADLVTAAALYDLVSVAAIEALAETLAPLRCAFCTVLTYDGEARFSPAHPADEAVRAAFNADQLRDKGFGPAAGPGAPAALAAAFRRHGFRLHCGPSPWVVDESHAALRRALDEGFAAAARTAGLPAAEADAWLAHRLSGEGRVTIVGHEDLLALPG
jgi:SAM-dependent methyltransferase